VGAVVAEGRAVGAGVVTLYDKSCRADWRGRMSSWVADSLATLQERLWRLERSC